MQDADRPANRLINPEATIAIARAWDGHPCVLRMRRSETGWAPCEEGWALRRLPLRPDGRLDAEAFDRGTHGPVIDPNLVPPRTDVLMTDEEFHDFAIQVAASQIKEDGGDSIRSQNDPAVLPSINWIDSDGKAQWALVQATRYGALEPGLPVRWPEFKRNINAAFAADSGLRAVVGAVPVLGLEAPLHRGQPMHVRWLGFEEV
ncbi:MAG: hypothetical protein OSA40_13535 [Phycisphaerales bacterium]|nr:hypothetical protein [Phycisphaerales bacterium]